MRLLSNVLKNPLTQLTHLLNNTSLYSKISHSDLRLFKPDRRGIAILSSSGSILEVNKIFRQCFGQIRLVNSNFFEILSMPDVHNTNDFYELFQQNEGQEFSFKSLISSTNLTVQVKCIYRKNPKNQLEDRIIVYLHKVLNEKRKISQMEENRYQLIFSESPELMIISDLISGQIIEVNKGWNDFINENCRLKPNGYLQNAGLFTHNQFEEIQESVSTIGYIENFEIEISNDLNEPIIAHVFARRISVEGLPQMLTILKDNTEKILTDRLLRFIARCRWTTTGYKLVDELLSYFGELIFADLVFASTIHDCNETACTFSVIEKGQKLPNVEFDLSDTPCRQVIDGNVCIYNGNLCQIFPKDNWLIHYGAVSYIGMPIVDGKENIIGVLALVKKQRFHNAQLISNLIQIMVQPVSNEILRSRWEQVVVNQEYIYRQITENISDVVWKTDTKLNILFISPTVYKLIGYQADEVISRGAEVFIDENDFSFLRKKLIDKIDQFEEGVDTETEFNQELICCHKNGSSLIIEMHVSLIIEHSKVLGVHGTAHDITERKKADAALKESELRFRQMFELHAAVMLLIEPEDGQIIDANYAAVNFYGYSRKELLQMNIAQINILPPEGVRELRRHAVEQNAGYFIFPHRIASGELKTVEVHSSPINVDGKPILFSIIHDITKNKEIEKAKNVAENSYRLLFENLTAGFAIHELIYDGLGNAVDYRFLDINHQFEKMLGLPKDAVVGRTVKELFPDNDMKWLINLDKLVRQEGNFIYEGFFNDPEHFYKVISYSPQANQFAIIAHDVTQLRNQEVELSEHEEQLKQIFENTHSGLILLNRHVEVVKINQAGLRLTQQATLITGVGNLLGNFLQCVNSLGSPKGCGHHENCKKCIIRQCVSEAFKHKNSKGTVEVLFNQNEKDHTQLRYFNISTASFSIKREPHVLLTIEDLTSRKVMELDLIDAKNHAEESDRLKSAFFNNLSHEIRTPLNGIVGFSNLLCKESILHEEVKLYTSYIHECSNRLLQIMNNIIELSLLTSGVIHPSVRKVNINDLYSKVLDRFQNQIERKSIKTAIKVKGKIEILVDVKCVESVFNQFMDNAIKFSVGGQVQVRWYVSSDKLSCLISDQGIGIEPEYCEKIFNPFEQVEDGMTRDYGGLGLGLAIAKAQCERVNGSVKFKSRVGKGSVFRFDIPLSNYHLN